MYTFRLAFRSLYLCNFSAFSFFPQRNENSFSFLDHKFLSSRIKMKNGECISENRIHFAKYSEYGADLFILNVSVLFIAMHFIHLQPASSNRSSNQAGFIVEQIPTDISKKSSATLEEYLKRELSCTLHRGNALKAPPPTNY